MGRDLLGEPVSVTYADWPALQNGDEAPLRIVQYVDDMLKDFKDRRNRAKKKAKKKKKGGAAAEPTPAPVGPPTKGTIFVQKKDPAWKCALKEFLAGHFDAATSSFNT